MKKYNKPVMKVHTCALSNEVLKCGCGSSCCCRLRYGEAKGLSTNFEDINFEENE